MLAVAVDHGKLELAEIGRAGYRLPHSSMSAFLARSALTWIKTIPRKSMPIFREGLGIEALPRAGSPWKALVIQCRSISFNRISKLREADLLP